MGGRHVVPDRKSSATYLDAGVDIEMDEAIGASTKSLGHFRFGVGQLMGISSVIPDAPIEGLGKFFFFLNNK